jgi:homoserine O-succinyltransferase
MEFEDIIYWGELTRLMNWADTHVFSQLYICWGAIAGLYHKYGIRRELMQDKLSGIYEFENLSVHNVNTCNPIMRGISDVFNMPHSRYAGVNRDDVEKNAHLTTLAAGRDAGDCIIADDRGNFYITGHPEYDTDTLHKEYIRDLQKGITIEPPCNYYRDGKPVNRFRSTSSLLVANWLNYCVYEETPYNIDDIPKVKQLYAKV